MYLVRHLLGRTDPPLTPAQLSGRSRRPSEPHQIPSNPINSQEQSVLLDLLLPHKVEIP